MKISAISCGEVIFLSENHFDCTCILRDNSKAASKVAALSFPMPKASVSRESDQEVSTARFPQSLMSSWAI